MEWIKYESEGDDYVPIEQWGKDHWSTFAYLETRAVDDGGMIDNRKMRCNARLHREFANIGPGHSIVDGKKYPTLLMGGKELENHDDWSCLEDMVAEDLIEAWHCIKYPNEVFANSIAKIALTELGWFIVGQLRHHKAKGGNFSTFCPELP